MQDIHKGIVAMVAGCVIWGLSPIYYRWLAEVPPVEVLAHRALWSLILFVGVLALQRRLAQMRSAFATRAHLRAITASAVMISVNWFLFIYGTQVDRTTETSMGYFMVPLAAVVIGRLAFAERLDRWQQLSVVFCAAAVLVLSIGLGHLPWISLLLAITFALYGAIKKHLPLGPVVSVTCEVAMFLPLALIYLAQVHVMGQGAFGQSWQISGLLVLSGPMTAVPMMLFSAAARRLDLATLGVLQYVNPSLQFFCAAVLFGEPQTVWHLMAFPLIWVALAIYSVALWRQEASRKAVMAASTVSATVKKSSSEASAKP